MCKIMDIEFHYYINYMIAIKAGLFPDIAHKIAYSAQYVDDNTEEYTVLEQDTLSQYNNIVTQSINPTLNFKEILSIFPVFHFIPGDDILRSSALRQDGLCRHMSTIPNSKIARNCLRNAIKSKDAYWIGIASHAYADTWAHQNFTGLKDHYNAVNKQQKNVNNNQLAQYIGHANVLHFPDLPTAIWYDFRLKDSRINNGERFIEAAKNLYKMYIKYADNSIVCDKPKKPEIIWNELKLTLRAIFKNDFTYLEKLLGKNNLSINKFLMIKMIGMNRAQRIDTYQSIIRKYEYQLGIMQDYHQIYDKERWLKNAIYNFSGQNYHYKNNDIVNDNQVSHNQIEADVLCDSGQSTYSSSLKNKIQEKLSSILKIYKKIHMWHSSCQLTDWYKFQEAAKKHHNYIIDKVIQIMRKDIQSIEYEKVMA